MHKTATGQEAWSLRSRAGIGWIFFLKAGWPFPAIIRTVKCQNLRLEIAGNACLWHEPGLDETFIATIVQMEINYMLGLLDHASHS